MYKLIEKIPENVPEEDIIFYDVEITESEKYITKYFSPHKKIEYLIGDWGDIFNHDIDDYYYIINQRKDFPDFIPIKFFDLYIKNKNRILILNETEDIKKIFSLSFQKI